MTPTRLVGIGQPTIKRQSDRRRQALRILRRRAERRRARHQVRVVRFALPEQLGDAVGIKGAGRLGRLRPGRRLRLILVLGLVDKLGELVWLWLLLSFGFRPRRRRRWRGLLIDASLRAVDLRILELGWGR